MLFRSEEFSSEENMDNHLQELNLKIAEAENQKDAQFFANLLSAKLLFRRASGKVAGKEQFPQGL